MEESTQSTESHYWWWNAVEGSGIVTEAITQYYRENAPEELFSLAVGDTQYDYPLLTKDAWKWVDNEYNFVFEDDQRTTEYDWWRLTSAVSRMSYASTEEVVQTPDEVEEFIWNGDVYTLSEVNEDTETVRFTKSDFYSTISTVEPFIEEFHRELHRSGIFTTTGVVNQRIRDFSLPYREEAGISLESTMSLAEENPHSVGGTYPILLCTSDGFELVLSKRSTKVMSWPGYWGVLPAGFFSPDGIDSRLGVLNQFYSEYCEELFGVDEGTVTGQQKQVREVESAMANDESEFAVTGLGIEALGLSVEVSGVYVVYDEDRAEAIKDQIEGNYEVVDIAFVDLDDLESVESYLQPSEITPPSAFAVGNALRFLKDRLPVAEQPASVQEIQ